jgi:pyruvate dehydrogenase (quinone)
VATTVGEFMLRRLGAWGVKRIYGYPGDGILGVVGAFRVVEDMQFIQVRHEEMAAFMACAHAKFTGEVGVCLATSGPGAIHLLNGSSRRTCARCGRRSSAACRSSASSRRAFRSSATR